MTGFTTAEDLADHGYRYVKAGAGEIARIVTLETSGSTGKRKRLYFTEGGHARYPGVHLQPSEPRSGI